MQGVRHERIFEGASRMARLTGLHGVTWRGTAVHLILVPLFVLVCCLVAAQQNLARGALCGLAGALLAGWTALPLLRAGARNRRRTEEMDELLLQSRKMAAIGGMSAGIAHEINTPLNIISQELEWMRHLLSAPESENVASSKEFTDCLEQIETQVRRCGEITHGMLNFARNMNTVQQSTNISRLMEDMVAWVERETKGRNIEFVRNYGSDLPEIMTDAPMLRHVVLNLLNNAAQAIDHDGHITVSTQRDGARHVVMRVEDTGPGIPRENLENIFNPFFTTKAPGKGTGLGLSICMAIVTKLGGWITVQSELGRGARFDVRLPVRREGRVDERA